MSYLAFFVEQVQSLIVTVNTCFSLTNPSPHLTNISHNLCPASDPSQHSKHQAPDGDARKVHFGRKSFRGGVHLGRVHLVRLSQVTGLEKLGGIRWPEKLSLHLPLPPSACASILSIPSPAITYLFPPLPPVSLLLTPSSSPPLLPSSPPLLLKASAKKAKPRENIVIKPRSVVERWTPG